jgi:hypothetical protein
LPASEAKTCGTWTNGPFTVSQNGKKWTCDSKRECTEKVGGRCYAIFWCRHWEFTTEYADCREATSKRYRSRFYDRGYSPWIPHSQ